MNKIRQWVEPISLHDFAPFALLRAAQTLPRMCFYNSRAQTGGAAVGCAARLTAQSEGRFARITAAARHFIFQGDLSPIWMGGGAFWAHTPADADWRGFQAAEWVLPEVMLWREGERAFLVAHQPAESPHHPRDLARAWLERLRRAAAQDARPRAISQPTQVHQQPTFNAWEADMQQALRAIRGGTMQKVVLARQLRLTYSSPPDPVCALQRLSCAYTSSFLFLFEFVPGRAFLGATPERLIAVHRGRFETMALAGSIRRGQTPDEDVALAQTLLESAKNRHEHALVVESIRARLAPISASLEVDDAPAVMQLSNIQHLQTRIRGTLKDGHSALDIVQLLHPTPAVGGLPREVALARLAELERITRGWYAGPVGWFTPDGDGEIAVALRSALFHDHTVIAYGGAGIVADSDPVDEWRETALKMRPVLEALLGDQADALLAQAITRGAAAPSVLPLRDTESQQEVKLS